MPILVTIASINYLFSGNKNGDPSLLNPVALKTKLKEELLEFASRKDVMQILDELDLLVKTYNDATDKALQQYMTDARVYNSSAEVLSNDLKPLDLQRVETFSALIKLRERFINALSEDEWEAVFS